MTCQLYSLCSFSQNVLPPGQPEQDACAALSLCGKVFSSPYSYQGTGGLVDLNATPCGSGEINSMWIKITIATGGTLAFNIIPNDTSDDYDFAVVKNNSCSNLSLNNTVRCNFNNNFAGSNPKGIVGISHTGTMTSVPSGQFGDSFAKDIDALAGETYFIMINNFGNDNGGGTGVSSGFTIDFTESTATFESNPPPALSSIVKQCSDSTVTVELTTPVSCNSIAPDGSDFSITPAVAIASAVGTHCISGNGYTSEITIHFAGHAPAGNYLLEARQGTDGNTLLELCGNALLLPASLPFEVPLQVSGNFLPPDSVKCFYSTITIASKDEFAAYLWNTGQTTPSINVVDPGVYTLHVTDKNACVGLDSIVIKDSTCLEYIYLPTAFTPNADGNNDIFRPKFAGATVYYKFIIYDRWGRQVFASTDPTQGWDGTLGQKPQPADTYVWVCSYTLYKRPAEVKKGTVVLIR